MRAGRAVGTAVARRDIEPRPGKHRHARRERRDPDRPPVVSVHGSLIEGAIYRLRTGVAWRDLPAEFGPWQTVWKRHYEFCNDGTWDKVLTARS